METLTLSFLALSFFSGVLTVLAPCILPLLPVIIGTSAGARSKITPYVVIGALSLSILVFTYVLKASTLLIDIPQSFWAYFSGSQRILQTAKGDRGRRYQIDARAAETVLSSHNRVLELLLEIRANSPGLVCQTAYGE